MSDVVDVDGRRNEQRPVLPAFDFGPAQGRTPADVITESVGRLRVGANPAATATEMDALETSLGVALPAEYRLFLAVTRSLDVAHGTCLYGVRGDDSTAEEPWVSDGHMQGRTFLVIGAYGAFADGDQLLFDVGASSASVYLYLHDPPYDKGGPRRRPCIEEFAPSFGLALFRIANEEVQGA